MAPPRSRPKTEAKFEQAVLDLVARDGCASLGINAVAQAAGADKVLIYRYFGDLDGLLRRVAASRAWLPTADEILDGWPGGKDDPGAAEALDHVCQAVVRHIRSDPALRQLLGWRRADTNPLTECFTGEWVQLWRQLPSRFANGLERDHHRAWERACHLTALIAECELYGEFSVRDGIPVIAADLPLGELPQNGTSPGPDGDDDTLPTNLL